MDSYRHKGLRKNLVETLIEKGITDSNVLNAIGNVPRHLFLDKAFEEWSYKDQAFPINDGQTISQPYTVALQTQLLDVQSTDKVLEVGTGSGYQAAVLSCLCKRIYSIERHKTLYVKTSKLLRNIGYGSIRTLHGDGYLGAERYAPYDKIIITAGASNIPKQLLQQLSVGGYLVIPVGDNDAKTMTRITKVDDGKYESEAFGVFKFVPFLKGAVH